MLIAAYDTAVVTDPPHGFAGWDDPFRTELFKRLGRTKHNQYLRGAQRMIGREEVTEAFEGHGFQISASREEVIELSYEER